MRDAARVREEQGRGAVKAIAGFPGGRQAVGRLMIPEALPSSCLPWEAVRVAVGDREKLAAVFVEL